MSYRLLTGEVARNPDGGMATALAITDDELRREIKAQAGAEGLRIVLDQPEKIDPWQVRQAGVQLLILGANPAGEPLQTALQRLRAACPDTRLAVVHNSADVELIMEALRGGADEFVFPPLKSGLRTALRHLRERLDGLRPEGTVLGIVSAKGGCGATTLACHLAQAIERAVSGNVLLADLHLHSGMVGFLTDAKTSYSMLDAAANIHRLDLSYWKALVWSSTPRLDIIPAPSEPAAEPAPLEKLREVLRALRAMYTWIVVDFGSGFNPIVAALAGHVDQFLLVSTPDLPALYQGKQVVRRLLDAGSADSGVRAVFNRMPRRRDFTAAELRDFLGVAVQAEIREVPELGESYADSRLAAAGSDLGRQIAALAAEITGAPRESAKKRSPLLKLLWAS